MKIKRFEDLRIWQISMDITKEMYNISQRRDFCRDFELKDQLRRAVVSISSNIVEGFENNNNVGYLDKEEFSRLNGMLNDLSSQMGSLLSYLLKQKKLGNF